ncbi:serine/threonine protein kinase [Ceratobasidium sp. UAMH 11750]|nr:serine/threonine protein kinase [Ceratobasidium sp. UAMH 11750]
MDYLPKTRLDRNPVGASSPYNTFAILNSGSAVLKMSCAECVRPQHLIYWDIKPDNFSMGISGNQVNVIDFGLAKKYRDPETHMGTARYTSIVTHLDVKQARRDDLESFAHAVASHP